MAVDAALVMVLGPVRGGHPLRLPLAKRITSIGSDATADIVLPTIEVLIASTQERHRHRDAHVREPDRRALGLAEAPGASAS